MGLTEDRSWFFANRQKLEVLVTKHAWKDYPERGFTPAEVVRLVKFSLGTVEDNRSPEAISGSYIFKTQDDYGRHCRLVLLLKKDKILEVIRKLPPAAVGCEKRSLVFEPDPFSQ